jgi:hypothetical protein
LFQGWLAPSGWVCGEAEGYGGKRVWQSITFHLMAVGKREEEEDVWRKCTSFQSTPLVTFFLKLGLTF